ncbi:hypothetical protein Ancab_019846 [Ancistrocladus abbreviatus]
MGPSPNSPPSTHTPGDATANSLHQVNGVSKSIMMYGAEGTGEVNLAQFIRQFDKLSMQCGSKSHEECEDTEHYADAGFLDDHVESFLSHDGGDGRDPDGSLKESTAEQMAEPSKGWINVLNSELATVTAFVSGFTFAQVGRIHTRNKVTSCHISSDGKILASAGNVDLCSKGDWRVLWNMDTLQTKSTPEEHKVVITDVRLRPNSTLTSSSFIRWICAVMGFRTRTIELWNMADNKSMTFPAPRQHNFSFRRWQHMSAEWLHLVLDLA